MLILTHGFEKGGGTFKKKIKNILVGIRDKNRALGSAILDEKYVLFSGIFIFF